MNNNSVAWIGVGLIVANFVFKQLPLLSPLYGSYGSGGAKPGPGAKQGFPASSAPYSLQPNSPLGSRIVG